MVRATSASGAETPKSCAVEVSRKHCITDIQQLKTMNFSFEQYKYMHSIAILCLPVIEIFNFTQIHNYSQFKLFIDRKCDYILAIICKKYVNQNEIIYCFL